MKDRLTRITYHYKRFPTEKEKVQEWYLIDKEGMITSHRGVYIKLPRGINTVSLAEARDVYLKLVDFVDPKAGEVISNLKFDLTPYYQYNEDGSPVLAREEYPVSHDYWREKTATYNPKLNRLRIWEAGSLVYQNWDGVIERDEVALADSYL